MQIRVHKSEIHSCFTDASLGFEIRAVFLCHKYKSEHLSVPPNKVYRHAPRENLSLQSVVMIHNCLTVCSILWVLHVHIYIYIYICVYIYTP